MRSMKHSSPLSSKEKLLPAPQKQQLSAFPISEGQRRSGPSLARSGGTTAPAWRGLCKGKERETEERKEKTKNSQTREEEEKNASRF